MTVQQNVLGLVADALIGRHTAELTPTIASHVKLLDTKAKQIHKDESLEQDVEQNANLDKIGTQLLNGIDELTIDCVTYANIPSVLSESFSFTKLGDIYTSEQKVSRGRIENVDYDGRPRIEAKSSVVMHAFRLFYPEQIGTDLYIPQVYHDGIVSSAVQNGSELVM